MDFATRHEQGSIEKYALTFLSLTNTPALIIQRDRIIWANEALSSLTKIATSDLEGMRGIEIIPSLPEFNSNRLHLLELKIKKASTDFTSLLFKVLPLDKNVWGLVAQAENNTNVQTELQLYKDRFWLLAEQAPVGIFISEVGLRLQYVNPALTEIFDLPAEKLLGTQWLNAFTFNSRSNAEAAVRSTLNGIPSVIDADIVTGDRATRTIRLRLTPVKNPEGIAGFVGTIEDVSEILAKHNALEFAVLHDTLTGLYNRQALLSHLEDLLSNREVGESLLLFCDLNGFKLINDNLGHLAGDRLLIEIASNLRKACLPPEQIAYRFAGDEFIILAKGESVENAESLMETFTAALNRPFVVGAASVAITASIGFAPLRFGEDPAAVIKKADERMYEAKKKHYLALDSSPDEKE